MLPTWITVCTLALVSVATVTGVCPFVTFATTPAATVAFAFVSSRPAEKVINEVSIMIGYQLKPGSESTLEVGGASYAMYTQGDGLWIKNAAEEERMVDAMRKSADVTVKGVSAKGTETTDTFSLKGLAQALDRIAQDCRR